MEDSYGFFNRTPIYRLGFGVPGFTDPEGLSDKNSVYLERLLYYCNNISEGIFKRGLIVTYQKLQSYLGSYFEILQGYESVSALEMRARILLWQS